MIGTLRNSNSCALYTNAAGGNQEKIKNTGRSSELLEFRMYRSSQSVATLAKKIANSPRCTEHASRIRSLSSWQTSRFLPTTSPCGYHTPELSHQGGRTNTIPISCGRRGSTIGNYNPAGLSTSDRWTPPSNRSIMTRAQKRRGVAEGVGDGSEGVQVAAGGAATLAEEGRIELKELHVEASESYLAYAMSVIVGRALPDVRDGLKPVHRRILYAMHELGLGSQKPFRKCARVVGEVLGKFHPHGDTAVYDSLVRMAQDFSLRDPLINGHGNFGSLDNDPPAAMRYTECKLQVAFVPNFDGSVSEPSVLPSRLPHLLINGSQGIAVGMATNIPPHNLGEVVDALGALIRNPDASIQELMEFCPGPDFPTGASIMGTEGIVQAYKTGHGSVVVRGHAVIEEVEGKSNRSMIVITELPYQTNKAAMVERVATLVNNKTLEGVSDIRDESDRTGLRVVIEVKRGAVPEVVLNALYRHTALQTRFGCNFVGLVKNEPKELNLRDFLQVFLAFRVEVVERRANHALKKAQQRKHLVEGLLVALGSMDSVVSTIRTARDAGEASRQLQSIFVLSPTQSDAVLQMPLRRLTSLEGGKLEEEQAQLEGEVKELEELLQTKQKVLEVIDKEAQLLKKEFGTPRRTRICSEADGEISDEDVVENETVLLTLSSKGYLKRVEADSYVTMKRGATGKSGGQNFKGNDAMSTFLVCRTKDRVMFFSTRGSVYTLRGFQIPASTRTAAGSAIVQLLPLESGEKITSILAVEDGLGDEEEGLVMLTRQGLVKRTALKEYSGVRKGGRLAIGLSGGDELAWVRRAAEDSDVIIASTGGKVLRFKCNQIRSVGRTSRGSRAMGLQENDRVTSLDICPSEPGGGAASPPRYVLIFTAKGFAKRVPVSSFKCITRGKKGVTGCKLYEGDSVVSVHIVDGGSEEGGGDEVMVGSEGGMVIRIRTVDIPIQSRTSRGVRAMKLQPNDFVREVSLVPAIVNGSPPHTRIVSVGEEETRDVGNDVDVGSESEVLIA